MISKDLTHTELQAITNSSLRRILQTDSLLKDIPIDVTLEEVISKIAVEHGQSITLIILRNTEEPLEVIVPQTNTTVSQLKKAIKRRFEMYQKRSNNRVSISWKYIWRTYMLECNGNVLSDDSALLDVYGVYNKSKIKFVGRSRKRYKLQ